MSGCPDPETLAALIDGRLDPQQAQPVRAHVEECQECFVVVRGTLQALSRHRWDRDGLRRFISRKVRPGRSLPSILAAAAVLFVLIGLGVEWWLRSHDLVTRLAQ